MFGSSTQYKFWTLKSESDINHLRAKANEEFISKSPNEVPKQDRNKFFLTVEEERVMIRFYERELHNFCVKFRDARDDRIHMPLYVSTTAMHYFKRFYLYNSVMDYHPQDIYPTCAYLACKIEEFYVTITDFVANIDKNKANAAQVILNNELMLTQELQFHLIIHQPFRPLEGLFIDLKTRFAKLEDAERCRPAAEEFLEKVHLTDAVIIYGPSQIAVAAMTTAVSKLGTNLDDYVVNILFGEKPQYLRTLIEAVRKIKKMVKSFDMSVSEQKVMEIGKKLEMCRNHENNPESAQYKTVSFEIEEDEQLNQPMDTDSTMESIGIERIS